MKISNLKFQIPKWNGQTLVELVLVMGLMAILFPALLTGFVASRNGTAQQKQRGYATALLKETEEAVKNIKNNNWTNFAQNGTYHTSIVGSAWTLAASPITDSNGLIQSILINDVNRDNNGSIVTTGGTIDPSTKKVVITISWTLPSASTVTSTMYLTRTGNQTYTETTQTQFNLGTKTGSVVVASVPNPTPTPGDGQVQLGAGGRGDWCAPNLSYPQVDLPKSGVANAVTAIEGKVFAGTGNNASGVSFAKVDITNPAYPVYPSAALDKTFDGYKTNGVFGETNYAYLATDNNAKEIVIIDLTQSNNGKYLEVGYFNAPGNGNGDSIFVSGNIGYMTSGATLYTFDLSSKSDSRPQLGVLALAGIGSKVYVVGNYAYVATQGTPIKMQVVNISNPASLSIVATANVTSSQLSRDVYVNPTGTRAYLAGSSSSSSPEFYIINTTTKSGLLPILGTYEANGMDPKAVVAVTNNKIILVGTGAEEYQVIDAANEITPVRCGGLNIDSGVNGVAGVLEADGDAYSYVITGDSSSELKIIAGGVGGSFSSSGTFESATYDAGSSVAFNRFVATVAQQPPITTIVFKVASAIPSPDCANATFTFVDPINVVSNGTSVSGTIPTDNDGTGYENPARCFRYRATLNSSDPTRSPVLYDVTINRSL